MYRINIPNVLNNLCLLRGLASQLAITSHINMLVQDNNAVEQNMENAHKPEKRQLIDEDIENAAKVQKLDPVQKIKRKNHVLLLGYLGKDYLGMQRNPGIKTIEEELVTALLKADLITTEYFENIQLMQFQRAARTDKGVSAARQVVNLKLPEDAKKSDINQHLPNDIRVFALKRVTKGFNSKTQCDARTYKYIIPTYAFAPDDPKLSSSDVEAETRIEHFSVIDGKPYNEYRLSSETLNRLNSILKLFEGTHNFHNFTSKIKPLDPRASRYIMSFSCTETFIDSNIEFAVLTIKGQSFMLHQIRKMVSMVVAILRNIVTEDALSEAFKEEKIYLPLAPGIGLSLNYVHYDFYNKRYGTDGIHKPLEWTEYEDEIQEFERNNIVKHIIDTEISDKTALNWIGSLNQFLFMCPEIPQP